MYNNAQIERNRKRLTTPHAAAVAGIISGVLFITIFLILGYSILINQASSGILVVKYAQLISISLNLVPFAGIAFLWFIGVVRDRLGRREDQFFSTVFLGSGLLYLALTFISAAIAGGTISSYPLLEPALGDVILKFSRLTILQITNTYGIRMAAVFMLSSATLWHRTTVMPNPVSLATYVLGLGLLVLINFSLWVTLIFPVWILFVSILILIINFRRKGQLSEEVE